MTELIDQRTNDKPSHFSAVLPCYNEADNIVALVTEVIESFEAADALVESYEVIVADDCSEDDTVARLRRAFPQGDSSPLKLIKHRANCGQSAAICSGIEAARYPWIVTLDGDGQNDPADIPALIHRLNELYGKTATPMICGQRTKRRDTFIRRISSKVANSVRASLLGDATPDTGCGLKLFSRAAYLRFPQFDHMHRFLPALAKRDGAYIESVPVNHRPRLHGESKYGLNNRLWVGLVDLFGVMWLQRRKFRDRTTDEC